MQQSLRPFSLVIGTQRLCCCECSPRCHEDHNHRSCIEGFCGMPILQYRFAACPQSIPSSGRRSAAVWKKRRACGHCAPLSVRRCPVLQADFRRAFRHRRSGTIGATNWAARLHCSSSRPRVGRSPSGKLCPKADGGGEQRHVAPCCKSMSPRTD
jgi:hypothetical protein